jgi:hypothetical protein
MQNIVVNGNQFNDQEYKLSLTDAEFDDIENKDRIDTILIHVKKINEEYGKLDKYNATLKDLQRRRNGILNFNMSEANEIIKEKVSFNLKVLQEELKKPTNSLERYIKENITKAKNFMQDLKD